MSKNTNLSFLTDFLTADIVNSRVGMNNASPQSTFDVTGTGKFSGVLTLGSTVSNGTYTYTLPSATGTLALTSDIPSVSGYVPYTGAAASVNLGVYSITANAINSAGSGSTAGQINLRSDAFFSLVNGYGSIASGTTNQFNLYQTTGAGVFRGAILSLNSITPSATRTFTFPDASGTLALSTDLGAYLPLTGGTLTGALNGTSASFNTTNAITLTASDSRIRGGDTTGRLLLANSGTSTYGIFHGSSHATLPNAIQFYNDNTLSLSLASTGAATFSNSVTVQSVGISVTIDDAGKQGYTITNSAAVRTYKIIAGIDGTSNTGFSIRNVTAGRNELLFTDAGAATFSSTINAGNSANTSTADSLVLHGKGALSGGIPYGDYGSIVLSADSSYTSGARRFLITNAFNATRFAIIQSVDSNTTPTLGAAGAVTSGNLIFSVSNAGAAEFSVPLIGTSATFSSSVNLTSIFPVLTVQGTASGPHIGSNWSVSANQDGTGRTIIATAGQARAMYFENNGDIVIPNNNLEVGSFIKAGGTNYLINTSTGSGATYQRILNTGGDVIFGINNSTGGSLLPGAAGYATVLYNNTNTDISFGTNLAERMRITGTTGRVGIRNTDPQGLLEVGVVNNNNQFGGHLFATFLVTEGVWTTVFTPPNNWAAITEFTWTSSADFNRSGAAYMRWAYKPADNALGVVYTLFNDSQNATATFRNSGGNIQILITGGGGVAYYVQLRIQGSRAA